MNLNLLKLMISKREKRFVIGQKIEQPEGECVVIGFSRQNDTGHLLAIYNDPIDPNEPCTEPSMYINDREDAERTRFTNRFAMRNHGKHDSGWPLRHVGKVTIDGTVFDVSGQESRRVSGYEWESVIELYEFMKAGWSAEGFEEVYTEQLILTRLVLEGEGISKIKPHTDSKIAFENRAHAVSYHVGKALALEIGDSYPDRVWFESDESDEKMWVQINRVYLMDIHVEMLKSFEDPRMAEQLTLTQINQMKHELEMRLAEICPRGMYFPVIEYECDEEVSLQFFSTEYLDDTPKSSGAVGFFTGADRPTGKLGSKLKSCVVQTAVNSDIQTINVELFAYSRIIK